MSLLQKDLLPNLFVMLKILSSEYQLYACGKIFRISILSENLHFARGSNDYKKRLFCQKFVSAKQPFMWSVGR